MTASARSSAALLISLALVAVSPGPGSYAAAAGMTGGAGAMRQPAANTYAALFRSGAVSPAMASRLKARFSLSTIDPADEAHQAQLAPLLEAIAGLKGRTEEAVEGLTGTERFSALLAASIEVKAAMRNWTELAAVSEDADALAEMIEDMDKAEKAAPLYKASLGEGFDGADATHVSEVSIAAFTASLAAARARLILMMAATPLEQAQEMKKQIAPVGDPIEGALRPAAEAWTLGDRSFGSTAELVEHLRTVPQPAGDLNAVYHFSHYPGARMKTFSRGGAIFGTLWRGAVGGAALSAAIFQFFALIFSPVASVSSMIISREWRVAAPMMELSELLPMAPSFVLGGAIAGVLMGAMARAIRKGERFLTNGHTVAGTLTLEDEVFGKRVLFTPASKPGTSIELAAHANAPKYVAFRKQMPLWLSAAAGLAVMALAMASIFVPLLIGLIAAVGFAFYAGVRFSMGTRLDAFASGFLHALALLAWLTAVMFGQPFWGMFPTMLLIGLPVGALWGMLALPRVLRGGRLMDAVRGQWWESAAGAAAPERPSKP